LHSLAGLSPPPEVLNVDPFDNEELDALLAKHGVTRGDFTADLLPLLRIPRLCDLAIRHRTALAASGDITRERLIYEDWKDRLERKGAPMPVGDEEFKEFVAELGRRLHRNLDQSVESGLSLTRRGLIDELGKNSGRSADFLHGTISEIVDGRWMVAVPDKTHHFRLDRELMPYVLGMALVNILRETPDAGMGDSLAGFMDPLRAQDFAVALLRAAVTFALLDSRCSTSLRRLLIGTWIRQQNFTRADFDTFWRLLPGDLDLFLSLTEEHWLQRSAHHNEDEILIKGIANAAERWPPIGERILDWCAGWLGTHWGDPFEGTVIGYDPKAQGVAERQQRTEERRTEWGTVSGSLTPPIPIRDGVDGEVAWLACRVLGILSYLPRTPSVAAIAAWAVSRAIMGNASEYGQVGWLMRLPYADDDQEPHKSFDEAPELQNAVQREAWRLLELDRPVATEAARLLLGALATPDAAGQAAGLPREARPKLPLHSTVIVDENGGTLRWDHEAARKRRGDNQPALSAARDLNRYAIDPECRLPEDEIAVLQHLAEETDVGSLWQSVDRTIEDSALEGAEAALARWAPEALGGLYRRIFASASARPGEALNQLGDQTPAHLLILGEVERTAMVDAAGYPSDDDKHGDWAKFQLRLAELAERPASEQIAAFLHWPNGPNFDRKHYRILAAPTREDFVTVADQLRPDASTPWLCGWLWYLCHAQLDALPKGYPALIPHLNHSDERVRQLALEVAYEADDPQLAEALRTSQWQSTDGMNREEAVHGSLVLVKSANRETLTEIRERIDPEALGFLAVRDNATDDDLDAFADFVKRRINADFFGNETSRTFYRCSYVLAAPVDRLVSKSADEVLAWLEPLLEGTAKPKFAMFEDMFPYIDLCRSLLRHQASEGAALWRAMWKHYDGGIVRSDAFTLLPFEAPDSDPVSDLRHFACDHAKTDEDLGKIATSVIEHGREGWLISRIHRDLDRESAGEIARGLTFAGLLDATPAAEHLWRTRLAQPPGPGWLAHVHERAHWLYQRNTWAHYWVEEFLTERDPDRAFCRHLLFLHSADHRAFGWVPDRVGKAWKGLPKAWQVHWSFRWPGLKAAVKKKDEEWKKTLFGSKITHHIQWPWR